MQKEHNTLKKLLFILWQCTWGLPQTLLGAIIFLKHIRCPHRVYRGCIDTKWNSRGGMSLGLFIFTPQEEDERTEQVRVHEYGHCIQSMVLGPLYLIVIGLVSYTWANLPYFRKMRREKHISYTACFVESWASKWGEWITKQCAIWN